MLIVWSWTSFVSVNIRWKEYICKNVYIIPSVPRDSFDLCHHHKYINCQKYLWLDTWINVFDQCVSKIPCHLVVSPWLSPLVHWGRSGVIAHSRVVLLFEILWGLMNYGVVLALGREGSAQSEVISSRWILGLRTVAILPWDGLNTVVLSYASQHQHI